jgi:hypothetical protein
MDGPKIIFGRVISQGEVRLIGRWEEADEIPGIQDWDANRLTLSRSRFECYMPVILPKTTMIEKIRIENDWCGEF